MKVLFFASFLFFHLAIALPPYPEGQHPLRNHDRHESPDVNVQCFDTFLESAGSNNIVCVSAIVNPPADTFGTASTQFSGYVDLRRADQAKLFFWLVMSEDNPAKDPVVLWMNGGPGASSLLGLFDQWGPKTFDHSKNPATLVKNPYRVTEKLTWIFLEQPVRVGFSSARDPVTDTPNAAMDVFSFLNGVMRTRFRVGTKDVILLGRDFHIAGESYAGHWIPAVAALIVSTGWVDLKLKSIIIGNGMIDVALLPDGVNNLFCANPPSLNIDPNQQDAAAVAARCGQMDAWGQACQLAITNCRTALVADKPARCVGVMNVCEDTLGWRWGGFADTDPYDFLTSAANGRDRFTFYTNRMATFMNDAARKTAIAADNIQWRYTANGMIGNFHASGDWVRDFSPEIQQVLNQGSIDVLLYAVR